jgi:hypothetical protein
MGGRVMLCFVSYLSFQTVVNVRCDNKVRVRATATVIKRKRDLKKKDKRRERKK